MVRIAVLAFAFLSSTAFAGHYRVQPADPAVDGRFVVKELIWTCGASACSAAKSNSRPAVVCAALARKIGALASFTVSGKPLEAGELEKCNARAARRL